MTNLKKIGALLLTLVLMLSISAPAFASSADIGGQDGVIGEFTTPDTPTEQSKSLIIYKEITAYNPEECTVNAPTITFNYTIGSTAALAGKDIWDANSHHNPAANAHATTKQGVGTPTITNVALVPGTNTLKASENGTANRFPITIDFSSVNFTTAGSGAGVYRYQIDETTTEATKNAAGIKEGDVANTLYLDVYVDGEGKIYGYVLFTTNGSIDAKPNNDAGAATAAGKTEGFVGSQPNEGKYANEAASVADKYYSFNLEVKKVVENDNYTKSTHHQFPFTVTLANTTVTANVLPIMTVGSNATQTALSAAPIAATWTPTIADSATVKYVGIPCGTTVTIKEQNDVVGVTYSAAITNADTNGDTKYISTGEDSNNAVVNCGATALAKATENHTDSAGKLVTFTNTLVQISPTGVVLRIAPYALMLGAGIVLFVLSRKRKMAEDEA